MVDENTPHLLIVDDDKRIRTLLQKYLTDNDYRTSTAADAKEAQAAMENISFDLIVLDVMMPNMSGIELTEKLRAHKNMVPILLLTARAEVEDRVTGLAAGADDYLAKPFEPKELLLRVESILRRMASDATTPVQAPPEEVSFGEFCFRYERGELTQNGEHIQLTTREVELLRRLSAAHGRIISRLELTDGEQISERTIDVQINRLRRKIEADPRDPRYLQTVRGTGYVLHVD